MATPCLPLSGTRCASEGCREASLSVAGALSIDAPVVELRSAILLLPSRRAAVRFRSCLGLGHGDVGRCLLSWLMTGHGRGLRFVILRCMQGDARSKWLTNPVLWGAVVIVVGVVVGYVTLGLAIRYDGPSDVTCSRQFGGSQSWVSCSDSAAGAAAVGALLGDTSAVTVRSDALLWVSRIAFLPAALLLVWVVFGLAKMAVVAVGSVLRRALRRRRSRRARR
jgi:hypothetical protein